MPNPQVNIIVPLYNEEEVFGELIGRLDKLIRDSSLSVEVILVDDGSMDGTPGLMRDLSMGNEKYQSVFLSRNFGHQLALSAGLSRANASDAVLIIDGDLQDPPELLHEFYGYYEKGYDVVYAVRENRKDSFLKRTACKAFYRILKAISYIDIPLDSGDFALVSRRVVDQLNRMPEESRFLRGMRSWIGYRQIGVPYDRQGREFGKSKYSLRQLTILALNGIFNFSDYPIKMLIRIGMLTFLLSSSYLAYAIFKKLVYHDVPDGFTALLSVITLFGGVQLVAIGIIGEYILRIFFQVKGRPLYIVKERVRNKTVETE